MFELFIKLRHSFLSDSNIGHSITNVNVFYFYQKDMFSVCKMKILIPFRQFAHKTFLNC